MKKPLITRSRLLEVIHYDPKAGVFTWRVPMGRWGRHAVGSVAGYADKNKGYWFIGIDGNEYRAHRLAWLYVHGVWPKNELDHRDTNRINNAIGNLREATSSQNKYNCVARSTNTTGFKGVTRYNGAFKAAISVRGKYKFLGRFENPEDADAAYAKAARKYAGEFARCGAAS